MYGIVIDSAGILNKTFKKRNCGEEKHSGKSHMPIPYAFAWINK